MLVSFLEKHADAAAALHARCFSDSWPAHAFRTLLYTGSHGFVFLEQDLAIGLILARQAADEAEILTFAVDPAYRNRGIGTELMVFLISSLEGGATKRVFLEVSENNQPALCLYRKMGFEKIGERSGYYRNDGEAVTALIMTKTLNIS
jgi:ribosomal-protein-alanine N-acetyltransferase